jgi:hypothetical protein
VLFLGTFYRKAELGHPHDFRRTSDFALVVPLLPRLVGAISGLALLRLGFETSGATVTC